MTKTEIPLWFVVGNIILKLSNYLQVELFLGQPSVSLSVSTKTTYSVVSVRERTIQTERPSLVGEVSANFCA
jgi:hypothetical protein